MDIIQGRETFNFVQPHLLQSDNYSGCRRRSATQERKENFKFTQHKEKPIKKMQIN